MESGQHSTIVNFIWGIADDILRDVYVRGKYRDVILPMTVLRRLDCLLEPTKAKVMAKKQQLDELKIANQDNALCLAAGYKFYNTSQFTLRQLYDDNPRQLQANMIDYIDGFSPNVREIIDKFDFRRHVQKLAKEDCLGFLLERYLDNSINLSPEPTLDDAGEVKLPGLSNHSMGYVFEELIRKFNEENNEEAGEHFTPREVIHLMAQLILRPIADSLESGTYFVYDCACGTGGMLTEAKHALEQLAADHDKALQIHLYGQEVNAETYAICKADLLIQGEDEGNIAFGSTLSDDHFPTQKFDFMMANPPYGKSWKSDEKRMGGKKDVVDPRFIVQHGDDPALSLLPRSSDGQLLFLVNMLAKMNKSGSRVATVHNGSSLFTGDAGGGESNIRRWIIENDWLEAIIGLPENLFYNTGIATYIWVLTNKKPKHRLGQVQLIDAREWFTKMRKNLGQKNCELTQDDIDRILTTFDDFSQGPDSKVLRNEALGFWKVTVERPLRYQLDLSPEALTLAAPLYDEQGASELNLSLQALATELGPGPHLDFAHALKALKRHHTKLGHKWTKSIEKTLTQDPIVSVNPDAKPLIKKKHKDGTIEYESDSNLRDTEQIPLDTPGGIEGYMQREVLPHVPDAWVDDAKTKIGYEIPFTRYFYTYTPPRPLTQIQDELQTLEQEIQTLLQDVFA